MKLTRFSRAAAALVVGLLFTVSAAAQTSLNQTTLSTAVTDLTTRVIVVASASGATANTTAAYIDGEFLPITAVSSTSLTVVRGGGATRPRTHAASALVYIGPLVAFTTVDPGGSCTSTAQQYLPLINISDGVAWNCVSSAWQGFVIAPPQSYASPRTIVTGTTAAASAYTILPTDYIVVLQSSGTASGSTATAVKSFTLPSHLGLAGKQLVIKDESGGLTATTNIVLVGTIDGVNSGTATVIQLKTAFGGWFGYAGSGGWFTISCGNAGAAPSTCK